MGCDIHIVLERKDPDSEWVGVYCTDDFPKRPIIARRSYGFFAEVAQVRGEGSAPRMFPRNLPRDVSRLAWLSFMEAPTDHHNPSHMSLLEFTDAWFRAHDSSEEARKEHAAYDLLGVSDDSEKGRKYRVVFWFDN